jgi:hypothetical protein
LPAARGGIGRTIKSIQIETAKIAAQPSELGVIASRAKSAIKLEELIRVGQVAGNKVEAGGTRTVGLKAVAQRNSQAQCETQEIVNDNSSCFHGLISSAI